MMSLSPDYTSSPGLYVFRNIEPTGQGRRFKLQLKFSDYLVEWATRDAALRAYCLTKLENIFHVFDPFPQSQKLGIREEHRFFGSVPFDDLRM